MATSMLTPPSSPRSHTHKHLSFPFDCIVVTSPDEASAKSAQSPLSRILEKRLKKYYPHQLIRIVSTFDSYGARCGSGGGTLAALEFTEPGESVLILHAGGDSSRCPTQMILGKAWTSLPCSRYPNPTIWLIEQIQRLVEHARFPRGTVVVAATDTLLTFLETSPSPMSPWKWKENTRDEEEAVVLGVTVPAVVTTAQNHGVYVLSETAAQMTTCLGLMDPLDVWQKPSVRQLLETHHPAPSSFVHGDQHLAWIDTGVIIFLPKAVQVLHDLSQGVLALCTRKGIEAAYEQREVTSIHQSLQEYAKKNALKIDLYTDILHNLYWPSQQPKQEMSAIHQILSRIPLKILVAPQGKFLHLGTTQELVNFVINGVYPPNDTSSSLMSQDCIDLSANLCLQPRFQCWTDAQPLRHNVALQSTFPADTTIENSTLVEYCDLETYESVSIGSNTMVSGWRNPTQDTSPIRIPSDLSVQVIALTQVNVLPRQYVYMVLGIGDGIKTKISEATIFGLPLSTFLERTGLSPEDLGWTTDINEGNRNLWNAMLHPVVTEGTPFGNVYSWLDMLPHDRSLKDDPSLIRWKSVPRVTLKQLHDVADAEMEWAFRQNLESRVMFLQRNKVVDQLKGLLQERRHDRPCDLQWILELDDTTESTDLVLKIIIALEDLALEELAKNQFDICGRAFMIASALLADFDDVLADNDAEMDTANAFLDFCSPLILQLRSSSMQFVPSEERTLILREILDYRRGHASEMLVQNLSTFSLVMERLSFCMNELSIASGYLEFLMPSIDANGCFLRTRPPVLNKWILSTSPARVDLAGGWSDTPPLCYEFGGSVTGMAVLVDELKPLSCRCRISPGKTGILLRSENRMSADGSLLSYLDSEVTEISHLSDFRDPLSDCALLKAALVCLCMVTESQIRADVPLQPLINQFCSSKINVRIEIVTASILPQGSGMGTSSILAAAILASVANCTGIGDLDDDYLLHAVLMLEQLLTAGGGWQDQAHGIMPGIKTVRSAPSQLPLSILVEHLDVGTNVKVQLEKRMILAFTGKTRLAKNILQGVLRRWARSTNEVVATVSRNVYLAEECKAALLSGNIEDLGRILLEYSDIKVLMAGEESGAMPDSCKILISELLRRDAIKGACLCGAGGGGFMVLITSDGENKESISTLIQNELVSICQELESFTLHNCRLCNEGLTTTIVEDTSTDLDYFSLTW